MLKRLLLLSVISLLLVSGWSHVLAAAICSGMADMPGCAMRPAKEVSHSEHDGMAMGDMLPAAAGAGEQASRIETPFSNCCANRPEVPPTTVVAARGVEQKRQDLAGVLQQVAKAIAPQAPSFALPVSYRQHAPPSASRPRHVLNGIFLI